MNNRVLYVVLGFALLLVTMAFVQVMTFFQWYEHNWFAVRDVEVQEMDIDVMADYEIIGELDTCTLPLGALAWGMFEQDGFVFAKLVMSRQAAQQPGNCPREAFFKLPSDEFAQLMRSPGQPTPWWEPKSGS